MPAVRSPLHIAGIGASAGGLEAMVTMLAKMRPTGRIAYVVAQHMAHDAHSELVVRLIQRESALPVVLASEGTRLRADTVYVIPSGRDGRVRGHAIALSLPAPGNLSTPSVNALFTSIAEASGDRAIGIVLSGAGSDGVAGCKAIRTGGGMTLAQDPGGAKFNGMPRAAIDARLVDHVLAVEAIGETLASLFPGTPEPGWKPGAAVAASSMTAAAPAAPPGVTGPEQRELRQLLRQVLDATGIDFSSYKEETLLRRVEKRKATLGVASAEAYQALIRRDPDELRVLQRQFLVYISSFFRDAAAFKALERALAALIAGKLDGEPVRVWVPGCASGEEPYTLAVIASELLGDFRERHPVSIIGTDLSPEALAMAREGVYRQAAFREMDAALRERYFIARGQDFQAGPALQACVRFEQGDVLHGEPPGNLDLVSCRNLLIYLKRDLQDRLMRAFHRALRPQGLLFIGPSESLSFVGDSLFLPFDHYHRVYRRRR